MNSARFHATDLGSSPPRPSRRGKSACRIRSITKQTYRLPWGAGVTNGIRALMALADTLQPIPYERAGDSASQGVRHHSLFSFRSGKSVDKEIKLQRHRRNPAAGLIFGPAGKPSICQRPFFLKREYTEIGNNSRPRGLLWCVKTEIRLRGLLVWGWPASVANHLPKSRANSPQAEAAGCFPVSCWKRGGVDGGVAPLLPGTTC